MAGKGIYFGKLLELLIDAIQGIAPELSSATQDQTTALTNSTSAQTTALNGNLSTMVTKIQTMIDSLALVNTTVGQNLTQGNVKAGTTQRKTANHAAVTSGDTAYHEVTRLYAACSGTLQIGGTIIARGGNYTNDAMGLYYSVDNGATKTLIGTENNTTVNVVKSGTISINAGQTIIFYGRVSVLGSSTMTGLSQVIANTCYVSYDVINLSVDGFIIQ